jgi:flavin reductase (DIM6/NTAB) family NADH-FMN oxidoreductase RutF
MKDRKSFAPGTLVAPVPPAMVTVGDYDNANVLTIAWTGILASQPPKTYISVRPSRHSYGILKEKGEFVINLPSSSLAREVDFVGIYTGAKMDKFEKCGLTKQRSEKVAPPTIAECPIAIECRVCEVVPMGSHDVFIADILSVSCHDSIIDVDGKMHFEKADLLAYAHGEYYTLGEIVGRFGFSTDKPKKVEKTKKNTTKSIEKQVKTEKQPAAKKPFYESAPRSKQPKKRTTDKNKGAPHGRKAGAKK